VDGDPPSSSSLSTTHKGNTTTTTNIADWEEFGQTWKDDEEEIVTLQQASAPVSVSVEEFMSTNMAALFDNPQEHKVVRFIWGDAYPKMCPRCALACDGQCGICIHNRHICGCEICKGI
jgi:hypothetical protein